VIDFARQERASLVSLCRSLGPDAPTLCEGWTTQDLIAHLVVRERRPDGLPGLVLGGPLAAYTERLRIRQKSRASWDDLLETIASGPPFPMKVALLDEQFNTHEYFVHHEDVRRIGPDWKVRDLGEAAQRAIWARLRLAGRTLVRRAPVGVRLESPGLGELKVKNASPEVVVSGEPGELLLFAFGRAPVARVELSGDPDACERLHWAPLGL
jgi:uncharacterized protein (TIGR03085 family)